jgi:hypothetical protein
MLRGDDAMACTKHSRDTTLALAGSAAMATSDAVHVVGVCVCVYVVHARVVCVVNVNVSVSGKYCCMHAR